MRGMAGDARMNKTMHPDNALLYTTMYFLIPLTMIDTTS